MSEADDILGEDALQQGANAKAAAQDRLTGFVERIENLQTQIDDARADQKEVYAEAKECGFDTKTLRKVISIRRNDVQKYIDEREKIDFYLSVVGSV